MKLMLMTEENKKEKRNRNALVERKPSAKCNYKKEIIFAMLDGSVLKFSGIFLVMCFTPPTNSAKIG